MVIDEAARVTDEQFHAVTPMLAVSDGDLWMMSTPLGKRGFFYDTWFHGGPEWERVSVPATECARISPEFLEKERKRKGLRFGEEYLCEFVDLEGSLFDRDLIMAAVRADIRPLCG